MKINILRGRPDSRPEPVAYTYTPADANEKPTVLDVLLQAQEQELPELAFRYGCRNALCGVCTVEVNGRPRLACRQKVKAGDQIGALRALPVLVDLVVHRASVNQALRGVNTNSAERPETGPDLAAYNSLNRCIECYACLDGCPLHAQNSAADLAAGTPTPHGNPYIFLKLQRTRIPDGSAAAARALEDAQNFGLAACQTCAGCKCGIGINLKQEVIQPLLNGWQESEA